MERVFLGETQKFHAGAKFCRTKIIKLNNNKITLLESYDQKSLDCFNKYY